MIPIKDYVDARDDAVESRLAAKLDTLATKDTIRNNVWGGIAVLLAVLTGLITFGGDRFDAGLGMADQRQAQLARDSLQDQNARAIDQKLDMILAMQKVKAPPPPKPQPETNP